LRRKNHFYAKRVNGGTKANNPTKNDKKLASIEPIKIFFDTNLCGFEKISRDLIRFSNLIFNNPHSIFITRSSIMIIYIQKYNSAYT